MSEASTIEPWIILGAIPEKPIYTVQGFTPTSGTTGLVEDATPFNDTTLGAESASVSKASPGMLYEFIATNASGSTQWFQIFDRITTPPNGTAPLMSFPVAASSTVSLSPRAGRQFTTGITWGWSTRYDFFTGAYAGSAFVYVK